MEPNILTSEPIQFLKSRKPFALPSISINIFGSCVSRDLLEYDAAKKVILNYYFARQSIISTVSPRIPVVYDTINLCSNFQKRQLFWDLNKSFIDLLEKNVSDYLIIDLVDERFPIVKLGGSYVTRSNALLESGIVKKEDAFFTKDEYIDEYGNKSYQVEGTDIKRYMDRFCEQVLMLYRPENIIFHVVKGAEFYYDERRFIQRFEPNVISNFRKLNRMWSYMYDYMYKNMVGCSFIDISERYMADCKHIWGLSPIHFQKEYYEDVLREINEIIGHNY